MRERGRQRNVPATRAKIVVPVSFSRRRIITMLLLVRSPLCEAQFTNSTRLATIRSIIHCLEAAGTVILVAMLVVLVQLC
jgi:hypothetical protein